MIPAVGVGLQRRRQLRQGRVQAFLLRVLFLWPIFHALHTVSGSPTVPSAAHLSCGRRLSSTTRFDCGAGFAVRTNALSPSHDPCVPCSDNESSFPGDGACRELLGCDRLAALFTKAQSSRTNLLAEGGVKRLWRTTLDGRDIVVAEGKIKEDFLHGVHMQLRLGPHRLVTRPLGICETELLAAYPVYELGGGHNFPTFLSGFDGVHGFWTRYRLAEDYLTALTYLHNSPFGTFVMCDAESVDKLLSQFVIEKHHARLILNDLDALPLVDRSQGTLVRCGHRPLPDVDFVAPEQKWNRPEQNFDEKLLPPYDEKVDVWRVPDVLDALMGTPSTWDVSIKARSAVQTVLSTVRRTCRQHDPVSRPTMANVLEQWQRLGTLIRSVLHGDD